MDEKFNAKITKIQYISEFKLNFLPKEIF